MPALIAPSPITQMTWCFSPERSRAAAKPSPAEIEVEACAAPNVSYALSDRLVKPGQPATLTQRAHPRATAGENLVRIGLMPDIPDQLVARGVEHAVQRNGQFHDAQPRAEMSAGHRNDIDGFLAQLVGQVLQCSAGSARRSAGSLIESSSAVFEYKFTEYLNSPDVIVELAA